ncbi:Gp49 family protein [Paracidovorax citrulli]|uniref:Uncharacterized protein n=2 Tax=Paracidovorax citrulli TaxID=80869 RepID=A1TMY1_PARC0|nr:Gp49 family protein [Paracidovorax citrulli]ABM32319.1 hypothetical protein Aave_1732 [Paracidovorax citrulli AAC00-1]PVY66524.1 N4 Gp49/Sf6 Gp66 family protein [Paracidovorax citrulli]QCX12199.1 hypothetical protein APS58_3441 [Paracidovorax citrulli]REG69306.1 N4 Gp49/Sf6 Gp66 family protein [Paracidovorax citrulli]RLJ93861.1 N4 Gp49/Sf6 Gp66 family protein [Paracidovorax citrulli]
MNDPITLSVRHPGPDALERDIQARASVAPRVTPADIEAEIVGEHYFTAFDGVAGAGYNAASPDGVLRPFTFEAPGSLGLLTFCVLRLRNGFTVTGESACASPENFNAEIGRRIAKENAVAKIWPLLGFRLRDKLHAQVRCKGERCMSTDGFGHSRECIAEAGRNQGWTPTAEELAAAGPSAPLTTGGLKTMEISKELPRYQSHKHVWALKIKDVAHNPNPDRTGLSCSSSYGAMIYPEEQEYPPFEVSAEYVNKHRPQPGGYYVQYADGYLSYSPAQAFEGSYTLLDAKPVAGPEIIKLDTRAAQRQELTTILVGAVGPMLTGDPAQALTLGRSVRALLDELVGPGTQQKEEGAPVSSVPDVSLVAQNMCAMGGFGSPAEPKGDPGR